ncbi:FCD domain-containing protein [Halieaceae bacterium IMCC8485]|uniref:FCD domain-containing protein n=1 Tax=Candidatus Seongchinamella marina TaxID=2518990 RepID=A0ABT3SZT8_9GAMM|nr:FCD domain-containing protein [Candidatus Seongchinamella marina]MCX2975502.1 FCD domain-containing protein [Candidatus Seongchinamella marina]
MEQKTLTDQAYLLLREDIVHGKFKAGEKLGIELLKRTYEVGATPLREALYQLSADGFVNVQGQRGFRVADMSLNELAEITDLRVVLEGMALTQSIQNSDDDWESRVVAAFHHLTKSETLAEPDIQEWEVRNREFHLALVSCCHSPWLMRFHEILYDQHKRYRNLARIDGSARRNVHDEHIAICDAALAKDTKTICEANEEHIRTTAEITSRLLEENRNS